MSGSTWEGLSVIFRKILGEILRITKVPNAITLLNLKFLGSLFSTKNSLTLEV